MPGPVTVQSTAPRAPTARASKPWGRDLNRAFRHWPQKWISAAMTDEKEGPGHPERCPSYG